MASRIRAFSRRLRAPARLLACAGVIAATSLAPGAAPQAASVPITMQRIVRPTAFTPAHISIPSIGLQAAPIVPVLTRADGSMDTPKTAQDVAWYQGVKAGAGNALFAGHHDWTGQEGSFYHLDKLRTGDVVVVEGEGRTLTFKVTWIKQMNGNVDATEILGNKGVPIVTLITCAGYFDPNTHHHVDRLVARGVLA